MTAQDTNSAALGIGQSHIEGSPLTERAGRLLAGLLGSTSESLRVGVDACDVAKLRRQLRLPSAPRFLANSFTEQELDYCAGQAERIAARWAAKEAVAKAIGSGFRGLQPAQIEIRRHLDGAPYVQPVGNQPWPLDAHIWSWLVSLGHEGDLAIAAAIALPTIPVVAEPAHADTKRSPR